MNIVIYRDSCNDVKRVSKYLFEVLSEKYPNNTIVLYDGCVREIKSKDVRIDFRCGDFLKTLTALRPDYYNTNSLQASDFLAQSAAKCDGKEILSLNDLCTVIFDHLERLEKEDEPKQTEPQKKDLRIIAVDFDGTLCENKWPDIGKPNEKLIAYIKEQQRNGAKIILWTCRVGEELRDAVFWCYRHGLVFDAINDNLPESIKSYGANSRKIFATEYIDDKNCYPEIGDGEYIRKEDIRDIITNIPQDLWAEYNILELKGLWITAD